MYDHDLNYYFNSDNIKNQDLVFEIFDYFETGGGRRYFPPLDFFNILLWNVDVIKKKIDKPFDILNYFKKLEIQDIERHLIYAFILKWFGGYPVNNLDPQFSTVLRLIEKQYISYYKSLNLSHDENLKKIREENISKGKVVSEDVLRRKVDNGEILFLRNLDSMIKNGNNQSKSKLMNGNLDDFMDSVKNQQVSSKKHSQIFISHSSKDKVIAGEFIDKILKLCLKVESDQIFFTSFNENTIRSGEDFRKEIKENLINASLVLLIISDNYKQSEVCLNEMGAAWVLNAAVVPFIISPVNYNTVGFIHNPNQLLKLNDKEDIIKFIDEQKSENNKIKHGEIDRHVNDFLKVFQDKIQEIKNDPNNDDVVTNFSDDLNLLEGDIVSIENRDGLYLFQNGKLIYIADDSEFSLSVYGFNNRIIKSLKYKDAVNLIDNEQVIPVLHSCKVIIDTLTKKKWLIVNEERRLLPNNLFTILRRKKTDLRFVSLSHQEVVKIREGDKLIDAEDSGH